MSISQLECVLVSSVLDEPTARFGPNICTALAFGPEYWESPEAQQVVIGINKCVRVGKPPHRVPVGLFMELQYRPWLKHRIFNDGLPLSCMEWEALTLIEHYHKKRIVDMLGKAYLSAFEKPEHARQVASDLVIQLQGVL